MGLTRKNIITVERVSFKIFNSLLSDRAKPLKVIEVRDKHLFSIVKSLNAMNVLKFIKRTQIDSYFASGVIVFTFYISNKYVKFRITKYSKSAYRDGVTIEIWFSKFNYWVDVAICNFSKSIRNDFLIK